MDRHGIAIVLDEIATLLDIQGETSFKARAFANAARAIQRAEDDVVELVKENRLESLPGIGRATAGVVRELVEEGRSQYYERVRARTPPGLVQLLAVPRLGPAKIRVLHEKLGVASIDDLERAATEGRIAGLPGFGPRTQAAILEGIAHVRGSTGRRRYTEANELGHRLRGFVAAQPGVARAELAGELRRACETVAGIIVIAETPDGTADALSAVHELPGIAPVRSDRSTIAGTLSDGIELRVSAAPPDSFATRLLFETGSDAHVRALVARAAARGLRLEPDGLFRGDQRIPTADEADIHRVLDLAWIPPELRESGDVIDAASRAALPRLITWDDLRGCFHCHTTWSDGRATVAEMAEAAIARGWRYLGIADHSQYAGYAGGLSPDEILAQHEEIDAWNERHGKRLWLFKGIEADVLPDGRVDYEDRPDLLERFDYVIASVHSAFGLAQDAQTRRYLRVLENPYVTMLGHLTGRLLLARPGATIDFDAVFEAAARRNVIIEINSDPARMEMDWRHWRAAHALGIRTAINPDAHSPAQLEYVHNGVAIARKAGLEKDDIVNCGTVAQVKRAFAAARAV